MNIFESIALKADEFSRAMDNATRKMEEFGVIVESVAEGVSSAFYNISVRAESIAEMQEKAVESFSAIGEAMNKTSEESNGLETAFEAVKESVSLLSGVLGILDSDTLSSFIEKTSKLTSEILDKFISALADLGSKFLALGPKVMDFAGSALSNLGTSIGNIGSQIADFTGTALAAFGAKIVALKPKLVAFGIKLKAAFPFLAIAAVIITFVGYLHHLWETCEEFRDKFRAVIDSILSFVEDHWARILLFLKNPLLGALAFLYELNPQFKEWVNSLISGITDIFDRLMPEAGRDLVMGLVNGVMGAIGWAKDAIGNVIGGITDRVRGIFGINSPSKVFADIGKNLGEGLVAGIDSMGDRAARSVHDMAKKVTDAAEDAEISLPILFGDGRQGKEPQEQLLVVEETLSDKVSMFAETFTRIKEIVLSKFTEMGMRANDILRRIMNEVDELLTSEGFRAGQNFFRALGEGLISVEAWLMGEALRVADAIAEIFRQRQAEVMGSVGVSAFGATSFDSRYFDIGYFGEIQSSGGGDIIQNFYGVREKETGYAAYRGYQKAQLAQGRL